MNREWWRVYVAVMHAHGDMRYVRIGYSQDVVTTYRNLCAILPCRISKVHQVLMHRRQEAVELANKLVLNVPVDFRCMNNWFVVSNEHYPRLNIWWAGVLTEACGDAWPWESVNLDDARRQLARAGT